MHVELGAAKLLGKPADAQRVNTVKELFSQELVSPASGEYMPAAVSDAVQYLNEGRILLSFEICYNSVFDIALAFDSFRLTQQPEELESVVISSRADGIR